MGQVGTWREKERERGSEGSWSKRLELCSPVVCTRWCSLIIHCVRWMSLSPHTALLHSALSLSPPRGRDCWWREGCIRCVDHPDSKRYRLTSVELQQCMHLHRCMSRDQWDLDWNIILVLD